MKTQFDHKQQAQALDLIENIAWGSMEDYITDLEEALRRALATTAAWFPLWDHEGERRYGDVYDLTPEQVADLSDEWRLAYLAGLLADLASAYGVSSGLFNKQPPVWDENSSSPAALLRGLNDILWGIPPTAMESAQ